MALALFMTLNLHADGGEYECAVGAQDYYDDLKDQGYYQGAAYELSEINYLECINE